MFGGTILLIAALTEEKSNVWVDQDIKRKVKTCTVTRISHIGVHFSVQLFGFEFFT